MSDPIAPHSGPISAYMSVQEATNLAYVRYFAKVDNAVSATFKNINAKGFTVSYKLPNDDSNNNEHDVFIEFPVLLTKREEIRPILENMATEAEVALGLPSSLSGPPPLKAIAKALHAQATDNLHILPNNSNNSDSDSVEKNTFYHAEIYHQVWITFGLIALGLLNFAPEEYLLRYFPSVILEFKHIIGDRIIHFLWNMAMTAHLVQGVVAFGICLRRGWYSPKNICKWTISTTLFGFASTIKLIDHAKQVAKSKTD